MGLPLALCALALLAAPTQRDAPPVDGPGEFTPLVRARDYQLNIEETELVVHTFKEGVAAVFAHEHIVRANAFFGSVYFDQDRPENSRVSITVRADKLVIDKLSLRARYGAPGHVSAADHKKILASMTSQEQLWTERYKFIRFDSASIRQRDDLTYAVEGDLTIRGVTKRIHMTMLADVRDGRFTAVGKARLRHSDFGYPPYEALLGAIKVSDEFLLHVRVVAD